MFETNGKSVIIIIWVLFCLQQKCTHSFGKSNGTGDCRESACHGCVRLYIGKHL